MFSASLTTVPFGAASDEFEAIKVQAPRGSLTTVAPIEIRNVGSAAATNLTVDSPDPLLVLVGTVDPDIPVAGMLSEMLSSLLQS